jgi:hypothetical protein
LDLGYDGIHECEVRIRNTTRVFAGSFAPSTSRSLFVVSLALHPLSSSSALSPTVSMKKLYLVTTRTRKVVHSVRDGGITDGRCQKRSLSDAGKPEKDEEIS